MHSFRNAVLSAPISFLVFASFRQAVRLACFAAASLATWVADGVAADDDAGVWGAAGWPARKRPRHRALAANAGRMDKSSNGTWSCEQARIAVGYPPPDEARMKLR
jgi:hypothetical protein